MGTHTGEVQSRLTRSAVAGLATAGSLVVAILCALFIVGSSVDFNDWPEAVGSNRGTAVLPPLAGVPRTAGPQGAARRPVTRNASERSGYRATRSAAARRPPRRGRRAGRSAARSRVTARGGGVRPSGTGAAPVRGGHGAPGPDPASPRPVRDAAVAGAQAVRATGRTAGAVAGELSPEAGALVTETTESAAVLLESVGERLP